MPDNDFDFDPNDIAKTMLSAELRARHAEDWAESRVAIANSRAALAVVVSLVCLFLVGLTATLLLATVSNSPTTTIIQRESPLYVR